MRAFTGFLLVFVGGGTGAMLRHAINRLTLVDVQQTFPWHTLLINLLGSLVLGLLAGWFTYRAPGASPGLRLFLTTGMIAGFTTFSTFALDVATL